ncbi:MAG: cadherin-like domain-containing protein [Paracoccaceae bacterium]
MIEVKGTRTGSAAPDPTDPMGLRKPLEAGTGAASGLLVGLLGLAVYLRSFLWAEPAQAQVATEPEGKVPDEEGNSARPASRVSLKLAASEQPTQGEPAVSNEAAADTLTPQIFFASTDLGVPALIAPAMVPGFVRDFAANTPLPPFDRPGRTQLPDAAQKPIPISVPGESDFGKLLASDESGDVPDEEDEDDVDLTEPEVTQRNRAPRSNGPVYLGDVGSGATLAIALSHLLSNTSDEDNDALSVAVANTTSGSVQPHNAGWRYLADADHLGEVEISFQVSDGQHSVLQSATLTVIENLHEGTADADLILGTEGRDRVLAHDGDDNIATFFGRDVVFGGKGDDNIAGGAGRDSLFGDEGDDLIAGGADADLIFGGDGDDRLYGEAGDDEVHGDAGNDLVDGGEGADTLTGDEGDDSLLGGDGDDVLAGGEGDDLAQGGSGLDVIFGDDGNDALLGDAGADLLFGGQGDDSLDGGADDDVLSGGDGGDLLKAGSGNDLAAGGDGDDRIEGGAGSDHLTGEAGNDLLIGGDGADTIAAGYGDDVVLIDIDLAADLLDGGEGFDQLVAAPESGDVLFDLIQGTVTGDEGPADTISGFEAFIGNSGDDVFLIGEGEATLTGNDGADLFAFVQGDRLGSPQSSYGITDFSTADTLTFSNQMAGLSMRKAQRSIEDRIEEFFTEFTERFEADVPRLRYFHEWQETYQRTIVEVDFDRDQTADLVLTLEGGHEFDFSTLAT